MKNLFNKTNKEKSEAEERSRRRFHSANYHRFFEGYSEFEEVDEKGHSRIKRVYTGDYYSLAISKKMRVLLKLGYIIACLITIMLFIKGSANESAGNDKWYVNVCQVADVVTIAMACAGVFNHLIAPVKMTIGDWKSASKRLQRGSLLALISLSLTVLMILLDLAVSGVNSGGHLLSSMYFLAAAVLMGIVWQIEKRVPYDKAHSEAKVPDYAARIGHK